MFLHFCPLEGRKTPNSANKSSVTTELHQQITKLCTNQYIILYIDLTGQRIQLNYFYAKSMIKDKTNVSTCLPQSKTVLVDIIMIVFVSTVLSICSVPRLRILQTPDLKTPEV